jgi:secretion/DNA translocation related TadE-like protein
VLVVACLALLLLVGAALGVVTAMVRAHRMAQSAADLAALAGAAALQRGEAPCAAAAGVAVANEAALTSCRPDGEEVTVTTLVTGPKWLGQAGDLTAEARAGPG